MANATIKYYPVGNGDCSLVTLVDGTTMLVDCNIRESASGDTDDTKFDVKQDLLASLKRNTANNPFVDVFVLTHGDQDHCRGFAKNFFQGDPATYSADDREAGRILIDEIWFSPMVEEVSTNPDEDVFEAEAMRRVKLHRDKAANRDEPGNRVVIIGYDGRGSFKDLNHLRQTPGNIVTRFNQKEQTLFSVFLHAPFKEQLYDEEKDKNFASIVFQARFKQRATDTDFACLALFGGDSDHWAWCVILDKTTRHKNDVTHKALDWDLFLAPHHCSWSYFNDRPQADNPTPKAEPLAVLDYARTGARVIASSKEVLDDSSNPPHYEAKLEYIKKVGKANFLNTDTHKKKGNTPQPIVFEVTSQGPVPAKLVESTATVAGTGALGALHKPSGYGAEAI
ncbi:MULTISPECIES: hypothetical protein [Hymenobacter]|uniref:Cobyric acid synthase CobQ n=1 Tax=Hymenobacter metallilatus TaxID=2493666 RepID=A0A3R9MLC4_9BACT|nr:MULTISPECIES: hypothetical protein [Hymenobacter]AII54507.1 hypothetical protein N008_21515 [Hymenobacter sp. APR13]RSK24563.1 cobyric acid synthase CobQ [Hymenobacter metallilatus]